MNQPPFSALVKRALTELALRTITNPQATSEHVACAKAFLKRSRAESFRMRFTPAEVRELRGFLERWRERQASSGSAPGPDPRAAG